MINKILQSPLLGGFALFVAAFVYATFGIFIRAMAEMFGDNTQVAVRFAIVAVILWAVCIYRHESLRLARLQVVPILGLSAGCAVLVVLFTYAVTTTTIASAVFSLYAGSIITSLVIGTGVFKERLTITKAIAIVVALAGLAIYSNGLATVSLGMGAGFLAGVCDGMTNALRKLLSGISRLKVQLYQNGVGALCVTLAIPLVGEHPFTGVVAIWPIVATLLFSGMAIGLGYLLLYGFQHFDINAGTVILSTELVFATIIGIVLFHEWPALHQIIGGTCIFIASLLTIGKPTSVRHLFRRAKTMA